MIISTALVRLHFVPVEKRTEFKPEVLVKIGTGVDAENLLVPKNEDSYLWQKCTIDLAEYFYKFTRFKRKGVKSANHIKVC